MSTDHFEKLSQEQRDESLLHAVKHAVTKPKEADMPQIEALVKAGADPLALFDEPFNDGFVYYNPNKGYWDNTNINAFECMMMVFRQSKWLPRKDPQLIRGHLHHAEDMPLSQQNTLEIMRLFLKNGMDLTRPHKHYSCFFKSQLDVPQENDTFFDNFLSSEREMKFIIALEDDLPDVLNINPKKHNHFITQWGTATLLGRKEILGKEEERGDGERIGKAERQELIEWQKMIVQACAILVKKGVPLPEEYTQGSLLNFSQLVRAEVSKPRQVRSAADRGILQLDTSRFIGGE